MEKVLKLKVLACDVLRREVSYLSSLSPCYIDAVFLPQGLHENPDKLRLALNEEIEKTNNETISHRGNEHYDYIILIYGLCDNSIAGLKSLGIPLVVPKAHDCITLLLGSKERYKKLFDEIPGIYWYSRGWIERSIQPGKDRYEETYRHYLEKYGEDNAEYLMETEQGWFKKYSCAYYIDWECLGDAEPYRNYTKECADYLKWTYREENGNSSLLKKMMNGNFDNNEVLVIPPGKTIAPSYNDEIIGYA